MKKIFVFLFSLIAFCSCTQRSVAPNSIHNGSTSRFQVVYEQTSFTSSVYIIKDTYTGHKYLYYNTFYAAGLTSLQD